MDACGCAGAAGLEKGGSAAAWEKGDAAAAGWEGMPKGVPLEPLPIEKGDPAGAAAAAPAGGWEDIPKGDPPVLGPNENGDPAAGTGDCCAAGCCGAGCDSENGLAEAPGCAANGVGPNPGADVANALNGEACVCGAGAAASEDGAAIWNGEPTGDCGAAIGCASENGEAAGAAAGWANENGEAAGAPGAAVNWLSENGEGCWAGGAEALPSRACAISPGSFVAGSATRRGSWGEIGT